MNPAHPKAAGLKNSPPPPPQNALNFLSPKTDYQMLKEEKNKTLIRNQNQKRIS